MPGTMRTFSMPSKMKRRPEDVEQLHSDEQHPQGNRWCDPFCREAHAVVSTNMGVALPYPSSLS